MSGDSDQAPALVLDTSTRTGVVLLGDPGRNLYFSDVIDPATTHGRDLVPVIQRLVRESGHSFRQIRSLAVGIGPGSYTGLRVGIAIIKTMAEVIGCPVRPVDSLLLPVLSLPAHVQKAVSIADAQRGAVAAAIYRFDNERWTRQEPPRIVNWSEVDALVEDPDMIVTGPGLVLSQKLGPLRSNVVSPDASGPSLAGLKIWLDQYLEKTLPVDRHALEPLYIRPSAAEEKRNAALAQAKQDS